MQPIAQTPDPPAADRPQGELAGPGARMAAPGTSAQTFSEFYAQHFAFVWRNAVRLGGLECAADDLAQEVFLVAHRRLGEFDGRSSARTWLFGILRNVVRTQRRATRRRGVQETGDFDAMADPQTGGQLTTIEKRQALQALHALLDELDDDKREVFVLAELEEMTAAEVANAVGEPVTTVVGRLRDARKILSRFGMREQARARSER